MQSDFSAPTPPDLAPALPPGWVHYHLVADRLAPLGWYMRASDLHLTGDYMVATSTGLVAPDEIERRWLLPGDRIDIWVRPMGGSVGRLIGSLVTTAISFALAQIPVVGPFLALGFRVIAGFALNALFPPPKPPRLSLSSDGESQNVLPNLQVRTNVARLGAPIPEVFGRHLWFPDLAGPAFFDFPEGIQRLTFPLVASMGEIAVESARLGEVEIFANGEVTIDGIEVEVLAPGQKSAIYPDVVDVNSSVTDVPLRYQAGAPWSPSFFVGSEATGVSALEVNIEFPQGLGRINSSGAVIKHTVRVEVRYRRVDDLGNPLGSFQTLMNEPLEASNLRSAVRFTRGISSLPVGRYEVNARVTNQQDYTDERIRNDALWSGLRGFSAGQFGDDEATTIVVRIMQTSSIASQSNNRFNILATRKLPHRTAGVWGSNQTTRSVAAAVSHLLRAPNLVGFDDSRIDLDALWDIHHPLAEGRGDVIDGILDERRDPWELLNEMLRVANMQAVDLGGLITFWRDEPQTIVRHVFDGTNIVKGSFRYQFRAPQPSDPDHLLIQYFDPDAGDQQPTILVSASGGSGASGEIQGGPVRIPWSSKVGQIRRVALRMHAEGLFRRKTFSFQVEAEGKTVVKGELVQVSHPMVGRGQAAHVVDLFTGTGSSKLLTLDRALDWTGGPHQIRITAPNGQPFGPIQATRQAFANNVGERVILSLSQLANAEAATGFTLDDVLGLGTNRARPSVVFGVVGGLSVDCIVTDVSAAGPGVFQISAVVDDARVHTAEDLAGQQPNLPPTTGKVAPLISGFAVTEDPDDYRNRSVSIRPNAEARIYVVRLTYADAPEPVTITSPTPDIPIRVRPGELEIAVWAIGDIAGPRLTQNLTIQHNEAVTPPSTTEAPDPITGLMSDGPVNLTAPAVVWTAAGGAASYTAELLRAGVVVSTKSGLATPAASWSSGEISAAGGPWPGLIVRVKAINAIGASEYVHILLGVPSPGEIVSAQDNGIGGAVVVWNRSPDLGTYRYAIKTGPIGFNPATEGVATTNLANSPSQASGFVLGTTHDVVLSAYVPTTGFNTATADWSPPIQVFITDPGGGE